MAGTTKVLVVGATGYIGKKIVMGCLAAGHETFVLLRPENRSDVDKIQMLLFFKKSGAHLVEGSFDDHKSLVDAVKLVDVVISAVSGLHSRSHNILQQLKLVDAISEAGNVKRFLPSEFGIDPAKMENALEPGRETFDQKMEVRRAIEAAGIPYTYVVGACFAGYFGSNLFQMESLLPPKNKVTVYGDGNVKVVIADEDCIGVYTGKTITDPRTLNKTVHIKPSENVVSQNELIAKWEKLTGTQLEKTHISGQDFLAPLKHAPHAAQAGMVFLYHILYEGCMTNYEVNDDEEASKLYPEVKYTRIDDYMKLFV